MSEEQFTPGPWEVCPIDDGCGYGIDGANGEAVCFWAAGDEPNNGIQKGSDAHLIAAAPELYEALADLVIERDEEQFRENMADAPCHSGICTVDICLRCQREIRAIRALAKARGEQESEE